MAGFWCGLKWLLWHRWQRISRYVSDEDFCAHFANTVLVALLHPARDPEDLPKELQASPTGARSGLSLKVQPVVCWGTFVG